jgi:Zn-finger protein
LRRGKLMWWVCEQIATKALFCYCPLLLIFSI